MTKLMRFVFVLGVILLSGLSASGAPIITTSGYIEAPNPLYVALGSPSSTGSYATWWHDGGPPLDAVTPDDSIDVFPDKNHDVGQWTMTVASPALVGSYMRNLNAFALNSIVPVSSYGDLFGDYELGEYEDYTSDPLFPAGTAGTPIYFRGENGPSGMIFYDVKDEMLVQFFSSDKNDGWIEVLVDNVLIDSFDTWSQGWWYLQITGMDPDVATTVELRTRWDSDNDVSIPSDHINTLDYKPTSQNWWHLLPGDPGYPQPDDFHIFFVAYDYVESVPEPATVLLMISGLAGGALLKLRRRRREG